MCDSLTIMEQQGGTCWFHSILNGWLLSGVGRAMMTNILKEYKKTSEYKQYADINACPMRGRLPLNFFWQYVDHMLKPPRNRLNLSFNEGRLIQNLGLRNISNKPNLNTTNWKVIGHILGFSTHMHILKAMGVNSLDSYLKSNFTNDDLARAGLNNRMMRHHILKTRNDPENIPRYINMPINTNTYLNFKTSGGDLKDGYVFMDKIFPNMWSKNMNMRKPIYVSGMFPGHNNRLIGPRNMYVLSHAFLIISDDKHPHAICGYICSDGNEYIYDSAYNQSMKLDWTKPDNVIKYTVDHWPGYKLHTHRSELVYIRRDVVRLNPVKVLYKKLKAALGKK